RYSPNCLHRKWHHAHKWRRRDKRVRSTNDQVSPPFASYPTIGPHSIRADVIEHNADKPTCHIAHGRRTSLYGCAVARDDHRGCSRRHDPRREVGRLASRAVDEASAEVAVVLRRSVKLLYRLEDSNLANNLTVLTRMALAWRNRGTAAR